MLDFGKSLLSQLCFIDLDAFCLNLMSVSSSFVGHVKNLQQIDSLSTPYQWTCLHLVGIKAPVYACCLQLKRPISK